MTEPIRGNPIEPESEEQAAESCDESDTDAANPAMNPVTTESPR